MYFGLLIIFTFLLKNIIFKRRDKTLRFFFMENEILYGQQNFSLPHDVVKLPSGGVYYKSKKKSLKVGYLTAADENILLGGGNLKDGVMMTLLRNKIYEPDIKPEELLDGDIQAVLIFLRNTSFGPEYTFTLKDPETNKNFETTIMLDELTFKEVKSPMSEDGLFSVTLPKSGYNVKLRPLTFSDTSELEKISSNYPKGRVVPLQTWRLNKMIVEIDGNTDKGIISQQIESLPIIDSKFIRNFMLENEPGIDLKRTIIAPSGREIPFEISFGVEFFRPFF